MSKIGIISGSHRAESQSLRIARYIADNLQKLGSEHYLYSLSDNPLPLWDEGVWTGSENWKKDWAPISQELSSCSGFVIVSPEWAGMAPAGLKNFFLLCNKELSHKPALIVAVSSGIGGSYPVAELRMSSYKNSRICYIPDHIIVRNVEKMLVSEISSDSHDQSLRARMDYSLRVLIEYSKALALVRESNVLNYKDFPHGM